MSSFKLSQANGITRRVNFAENPSWFALATKIELLFNIPIQNVAVSYVDTDGDEVTVSTGEELDDYYHACHVDGEIIKFTVSDLSVTRSSVRTPPTNISARHSLSGDLFDRLGAAQAFPDITDDTWQAVNFNDMFLPEGAHTPPHIEVVDTTSISQLSKPLSTSSSDKTLKHPMLSGTADALEQPSSSDAPGYTSQQKGKSKDVDTPDIAHRSKTSTLSLVDGESDVKKPINVLDVSALALPSEHEADSLIPLGVEGPLCHIITEEPMSNTVPTTVPSSETAPLTTVVDIASQSAAPPPSFVNDITSFLTSVSDAFTSHPELSEGWRNIIRSASNGQYWQPQREVITDATRQATSVFNNVLDDHSRTRIAEAVGGVFKALSEAATVVTDAVPSASGAIPVPRNTTGIRATDGAMGSNVAQADSAPPIKPMQWPVPADPRSSQKEDNTLLPTGSGSNMRLSRKNSPLHKLLSLVLQDRSLDEIDQLMKESGFQGRTRESLLQHEEEQLAFVTLNKYPVDWERHVLASGLASSSADIPDMYEANLASNLDAHRRAKVRKTQLEIAKAQYKKEKELFKLEKERFRSEKEERERRRQQAALLPTTTAMPIESTPVSYRPSAGVSVITRDQQNLHPLSTTNLSPINNPSADSTTNDLATHHIQRSQTWSHVAANRQRHLHRAEQINRNSTITEAATFRSVMQRLKDMGFNETTNPSLDKLVEKHLTKSGNTRRLTKEKEDELVTNLLEELIANDTPPASRAGPSDPTTMPGEW